VTGASSSGRRHAPRESGVSVAHSSYHKHSAYILGNADMPGFSRMDQGRLARMVLAHRGKLSRVGPLDPESPEWRLILCLRLAAVVHRARDGRGVPPLRLKREGRGSRGRGRCRVAAQPAAHGRGAGRGRAPVAGHRPAPEDARRTCRRAARRAPEACR
jgi:hypothetical protein